MNWHEIENWQAYQWSESEKQQMFRQHMHALTQYHLKHSQTYQRIMSATPKRALDLANPPPLAAKLFKQFTLQSVESGQVSKTITSSGTSNQQVSKIILDKGTIVRQQKVLVNIMKHWIGKQRLPMLIIDHPNVIKDKSQYSARGAGIQGLMLFGRDFTYALNQDMSLNVQAIEAFFDKYKSQPVLLFGFTFMVWQHFIQALIKNKNYAPQSKSLSFEHGILLHSGGWKRLQKQAVSNQIFKQQAESVLGNLAIHNFYGMAEQTGTVYVECSHGMLHTSVWGDVEVMSLQNIEETANVGEQGIVKVSSLLPGSYPGHVILTEDIGIVHGIDNCLCGLKGKFFTIEGRLKDAEIRGCSNV